MSQNFQNDPALTVVQHQNEIDPPMSTTGDLSFTIRFSSPLAGAAVPSTWPLASLRYNPRTQSVFLTNPCVYQPVFVNGNRLCSSGEVELRSGCLVELAPFDPQKAPMTANGSLPHPPEFTSAGETPAWKLREDQEAPQSRFQPQPTLEGSSGRGHGTSRRNSSPVPALPPRRPSIASLSIPWDDPSCKAAETDEAPVPQPGVRSVSQDACAAPRRSVTGRPSLSLLSVNGAGELPTGAPLWSRLAPCGPQSPLDPLAVAIGRSALVDEAGVKAPVPCLEPNWASITIPDGLLAVRMPGTFDIPSPPTVSDWADTSSARREAAAVVGTTDTASLSASAAADMCSASAALERRVSILPVALCVKSMRINEATLVQHNKENRRVHQDPSAVPARHRLSSLLSDTILSGHTHDALLQRMLVSERRVLGTSNMSGASAAAAATRTLALFSAHFDDAAQRLCPFKTTEKRELLQCFTATRAEFVRLQDRRPLVLTLQTPLFCCGEVNGCFADLWGAALHQLCPFGQVALLTTPVLLLGNYLSRLAQGRGGSEEDVEVVLALVALSVAAPASVHMLRGRNECFDGDKPAYFSQRCRSFFGEKHGLQFSGDAMDVLACLPLAAIVDNRVFASHGGLPSTALGAIKFHFAAASPLHASSSAVSSRSGCEGATLFDSVLCDAVPREAFRFRSYIPDGGALNDPLAAACRLLVTSLVGGDARATETPTAALDTAAAKCLTEASQSSVAPLECPDPLFAVVEFLRQRGFSLFIRGMGSHEAGVCVSHSGRVISLATSKMSTRAAPPTDTRAPWGSYVGDDQCGGGCLITRTGLQIVCWKRAHGNDDANDVSLAGHHAAPGRGAGSMASVSKSSPRSVPLGRGAPHPLLAAAIRQDPQSGNSPCSPESARHAPALALSSMGSVTGPVEVESSTPVWASQHNPLSAGGEVHYVMGVPMPSGRGALLEMGHARPLSSTSRPTGSSSDYGDRNSQSTWGSADVGSLAIG